jgi:endonuclease/exonuclease/phosphatase family protein
MVAENYGRIVDDLLKIPFEEIKYLPHEILSDKSYVDMINKRWNKNVLLMGDFNDDPFDKSISKFLRAKNDKEVFIELNESLEIFRNIDRDNTDKQHYLQYTPPLFNCMWNVSGFSYYHRRNNSTNLFDQFIISRGLLLGVQKLRMNLEKVKVYSEGLTIGDNLTEAYLFQ